MKWSYLVQQDLSEFLLSGVQQNSPIQPKMGKRNIHSHYLRIPMNGILPTGSSLLPLSFPSISTASLRAMPSQVHASSPVCSLVSANCSLLVLVSVMKSKHLKVMLLKGQSLKQKKFLLLNLLLY